jgi:hypothetical protein
MRPVDKLPPSFQRYQDFGGVLDFAVFEDAQGTEDEVLEAVPSALSGHRSYDPSRLRALGGRRIDERQFFGKWYDCDSGDLIKRGSHKTADRRALEDPKLRETHGVKLIFSGWDAPDPGESAGFAYAFSLPPYPLWLRPAELQELFDEIVRFILPGGCEATILDWTNPYLPEVSDYFEDGMEWWGVFLFSIHIPAIQRLTIIAGSTTD